MDVARRVEYHNMQLTLQFAVKLSLYEAYMNPRRYYSNACSLDDNALIDANDPLGV